MSGFRNPFKYGHWKTLSKYFSDSLYKRAKYRVLIVEKIEETGRTNSGKMDPKWTQFR